MKYEIDLHKTERRTVQIEAENHDMAYSQAIAKNPGFTGQDVVEVLDDDGPGQCFTLNEVCEGCGTRLWNNDPCKVDSENGIAICMACDTDEPPPSAQVTRSEAI